MTKSPSKAKKQTTAGSKSLSTKPKAKKKIETPTTEVEVTTTVTTTKTVRRTKKKPEKVRVIFVLDRSGSMASVREDAIGGFNTFIDEQRKVPGEVEVTLALFDDQHNVPFDSISIEQVTPLTAETYVPRGMTALYDAVGLAITRAKASSLTTKTIIAVMTDGEENASKEYSYQRVKQLIDEAEDELGWDVVFIGAGLNASRTASMMGVKSHKAAIYDPTKYGTTSAINTVAYAANMMRGASYSSAAGVMDASSLDLSKLYASTTAGDMAGVKVSVDVTATKAPPKDKAPTAK